MAGIRLGEIEEILEEETGQEDIPQEKARQEEIEEIPHQETTLLEERRQRTRRHGWRKRKRRQAPTTPTTTPLSSLFSRDNDPTLPLKTDWKRRYPGRQYFYVYDISKLEWIFTYIVRLLVATEIALAVFARCIPNYTTVYKSLATSDYLIRLLYKWYRVQGGFDSFMYLMDDFQPGAIGLIVALWGTDQRIIRGVNFFSTGFTLINVFMTYLQNAPIPILKKLFRNSLRVKQARDRYEDIGLSGFLPSNEATNLGKITKTYGWYYSLEKIEKPTDSVENPATDADPRATITTEKEYTSLIGTMMVSYSDNGKWVTIMQKAEDRAVKISMETFSEEQKCNFIRTMKAWEHRPQQGILEGGFPSSCCFTLARLIDLTKQGYSVCAVETYLDEINVT